MLALLSCGALLGADADSGRAGVLEDVATMNPAVEVTVTAVDAPEPRLHVRLTNTSGVALETYEHALPWRGVYSLLVVAVKTDPAGSVLERTLPIDDPGAGTVTVMPGQALEGDVLLTNRFPGFEQARADKDLLVFWGYRFQPLGRAPLPWSGGFVLFPRATSGPASSK
jgi:hypothetical protein